jgi:hypothetical protein
MKNKSKTFAKFKVWEVEVENQIGKRIKCLKTDNGMKYILNS